MKAVCIYCLWTTSAAVLTLTITVSADLSELTAVPSCYEGALESSSTPGMPGGFCVIDDPSSNDHVTSIVQLSMTRLNNIADNSYRPDTSANDAVTAFQQVLHYFHRLLIPNDVGYRFDAT